jgi:hypothetical protein
MEFRTIDTEAAEAGEPLWDVLIESAAGLWRGLMGAEMLESYEEDLMVVSATEVDLREPA